jgi:hypothetical protein
LIMSYISLGGRLRRPGPRSLGWSGGMTWGVMGSWGSWGCRAPASLLGKPFPMWGSGQSEPPAQSPQVTEPGLAGAAVRQPVGRASASCHITARRRCPSSPGRPLEEVSTQRRSEQGFSVTSCNRSRRAGAGGAGRQGRGSRAGPAGARGGRGAGGARSEVAPGGLRGRRLLFPGSCPGGRGAAAGR